MGIMWLIHTFIFHKSGFLYLKQLGELLEKVIGVGIKITKQHE